MSVVVIGLNHRTAPLDLLERMSIGDGQLSKALHDLTTREHISEALVLSTCNRTEVYACLLYTSPSPRDGLLSRMPSSA